jgi:predicted metal-binding membrane protein
VSLGQLRPGSLARRDVFALVSALLLLVAVCWWYLANMSRDMANSSSAMGVKPWAISDFSMMFVMWTIMMIAMMVPTAMRSVLIFTGISAQQERRGRPFVSGYWFAAGYIIVWTAFSVGATVLQWGLDQAALLSPRMALYSPFIGALIFMMAGVWQMSPLKDTCLRHCRSPLVFLAQNFRPGKFGAVRLGLRHGLYCLGCCWLLMGLLFIGGVMNIVWIIAITIFMLVEKLLPPTLTTSRISGMVMLLAGGGYLAWFT